MIYFDLQHELQSQSLVINSINMTVLLILIIILLKTSRHVVVQEYNAKPTYLRYVKYDPESGNIRYTD